MKSPDEIKRGLDVCNIWMVDEPNHCKDCPYFCTRDCADTLMKDALAYIKQLEDKMQEAMQDRDMAIADLDALCGRR